MSMLSLLWRNWNAEIQLALLLLQRDDVPTPGEHGKRL